MYSSCCLAGPPTALRLRLLPILRLRRQRRTSYASWSLESRGCALTPLVPYVCTAPGREHAATRAYTGTHHTGRLTNSWRFDGRTDMIASTLMHMRMDQPILNDRICEATKAPPPVRARVGDGDGLGTTAGGRGRNRRAGTRVLILQFAHLGVLRSGGCVGV